MSKGSALRIVGVVFTGVVAVALFIYSMVCFGNAYELHRDRIASETAEPIRISVDLSIPGEYSGEFHQLYVLSHGEEIYLEVTPPFRTIEEAHEALAGLVARVRILDRSDDVLLDREVTGVVPISRPIAANQPSLCHFAPFRKGRHEFSLIVTGGAQGLEGRSQELVARYLPCGLEKLGVIFSWGVAVFVLLMAALFAL